MTSSWKVYLVLIFVCLIIQAFFAMMEMACVSFNKVRLQYYVSKNKKRAIWLSQLLHRPGVLFGTTLIGVNVALQVGSECSRHFYDALGISPDFAPLSQIFLVIIFAEIAPLIAGRRYAEHAALLGMPLLYTTSLVLRPVIWFFDLLCRFVHKCIGKHEGAGLYLSREEIQKVLEEREEEFNTVVTNIFSLKNKTAKELMQPLKSVRLATSFYTVAQMRELIQDHYSPYVPIYHKNPENIVAIAYPRDFLRLGENKRIRDHARSPWFITESDSVINILKQFRRNNQSIAIVLNKTGLATGILTLDEIVDEIFGQSDAWMSFGEVVPRMHHVVVDRTFPGETKIADFNKEHQVHLTAQGFETLAELVAHHLGHPPVVGESVRIDQFELTVEEASLMGAKTIAIRTVF